MTHTPGPWEIRNLEGGAGRTILNDHNDLIATISWKGIRDADARLIASAPDLLAALKRAFYSWYDNPRHLEVLEPEWVGMARAAIAKATNEEA